MARFAKKASWQRHRAALRYQEMAERARKVPLPTPEEPAALQGQGLRRARAPDVLRDLEVYSTPAPTVHIVQQQPARQTVAASSCYVAVGRCGYVPPRLRLTHHERDSDKYHAVRSMLNNLLKLGPEDAELGPSA